MKKRIKRRLIVVLGMHRSGTSAIARGLKALGVELGNNFMPPLPNNNEKGFWEDLEIYGLNEEVLATLGCNWNSLRLIGSDELTGSRLAALRLRAIELLNKKFGNGDIFGFKDPRVCRLLPFWQQVFSHLKLNDKYVISLRNPLSVEKSLAARDGFNPEKSHLLWLEHVIPSLSWTEGKPRVVIDYDLLMNDPVLQMKRLASNLGIVTDESTKKELPLYAEDFLEEKLRHTKFEPKSLAVDPRLPELAADAYRWLLKFAADKASVHSPTNHDTWRRIEQSFKALAPVYDLLDRETRELATAKQIMAEREGQITNLNHVMAEREGQITNLNHVVTEREGQITNLNHVVTEREGQIANLHQAVAEREGQIANLHQAVAEREGQIANLNHVVAEHNKEITRLMEDVAVIQSSRSWRVTKPLRWCVLQARRGVRFWRAGSSAARDFGWAELARRTLWVWREDGMSGVRTLASRRIALLASRHSDTGPVVSSPSKDYPSTPSIDKPGILFVSHDASRTGAPIFLLNLITRLAGRLNIAFTILLARGGELEPEFRKLGTTLVLGGPNEIDPSVLDALKQRNIRLAYFSTITNGALQARLKVLGCPVLCHVHELAFSIEHFFGERNLKQVLASTDLFLAGSKAVQADLERWVKPHRVALAYPFIDVHANQQAVNPTKPPLDLPRGAVVVGACGTISWRKGTDLFIQLAQRVLATSDVPVVFVWLGGPLAQAEYRGLRYDIEHTGIERHIIFTGHVERHLPYLAQFDIFVLPSREDPFPLVMLDAASLGKPLVCFERAGGMPEFVENDAGFVVPYLDVNVMGTVVRRLSRDPELRATLGQCARRKVIERHDVNLGAERIAGIVQQFLAPQSV